jgi:alcohol dehydrogenase
MRVRGAVVWEAGRPAPYVESRPVDVTQLELEEPGPGELLVRIGAAGLCHSDLSVIDGSRTRELPIALGHEAAGEVVALGPGTTGFAPGDHVVLAFVPPCGACAECAAGHASRCGPAARAGVAGTLLSGQRRVTTADGGTLHHHSGVSCFADHVVVDARSATRVDPDLPWDVAAVFGCAVLTGVGAAIHAADVQEGERVAVFGLGGVGLSAVMGARMAGADVIAVDVLPGKLSRAERLGATPLLSDGDVVAALRDATDGGADTVIDATGRIEGLTDAYAATRRGGLTVTVGLPHPEHALAVPATALGWRSARCAAPTWATASPRATCRASSPPIGRGACPSTSCSPTTSPSTTSTRASTACATARRCGRRSCSRSPGRAGRRRPRAR